MEYINEVLVQMFEGGIFIPALMIGYYLTFHRFATVILPLVIYAVVDHLLLNILHIIELQQNTFAQLGAKITQIDWLGIMIKNAWQDIIAFFIIGFVTFSLCKIVRKLKN